MPEFSNLDFFKANYFNLLRLWLLFLTILTLSFLWDPKVYAQSSGRPKTDNTDRSVRVVHKKVEPESIEYNYLYKKDAQGLLLGNKCVEEVTDEMGVQYVVSTGSDGLYRNELDRLWKNFKVKTKLFFTRGPFWKFKIKKARKECRQLTRDLVG
jgi:hypothetical protein